MKKKQLFSVALAATMVVSSFAGCGKKGTEETNSDPATTAPTKEADNGSGTTATEAPTDNGSKEIKEFTAFFAIVPTTEVNDDNEVKNMIAEKIGAKCQETWLVGQEAKEAVGTFIAGGDYPDFMEGAAGQSQLYNAGAFIPLDDLIEKYPNVKNLLSTADWNALRQDDGHIYWIPQFSAMKGEEKLTVHNYEAFWIQQRVLKWANWPKLETLDEYFDLIEKYLAEGEKINGIDNIGFTMLCTENTDFALENPPMFLAGYPNDGCCIVNTDTLKVEDYNKSDIAQQYFKKMNEEFKKNVIAPESFTQTVDEYRSRLCSGAVLGIVDQWWNFAYTVNDSLKSQGLDEKGCMYVPTAITLNKGDKEQWHTSGVDLNVSSGIGITVSCKDPDGAMKFINDLLDQEIHTLRFWGVENVDYQKDDQGYFYRTPEQRLEAAETVYKTTHLCPYSYFPQYSGTCDDGINATKPENQGSELYDNLPDSMKECFDAYNAKTYCDFFKANPKPGPWYPMWTFSNTFDTTTPGGTAWQRMKEVRLEWLPKVIMSDDFDKTWNDYMAAFDDTNPNAYLEELQAELDKRIATYNELNK